MEQFLFTFSQFDSFYQFLFVGAALLLCISVHEASHALVAYYLGDPTAKLQGRLTLNPIAHLDLLGTIVFLATRFIGWGKPVPVNPRNFENPVRDSALTSLAGPFSNFIFAFILTLPLKYLGAYMSIYLSTFLWTVFHINIFLGVFNLFPFPPLDGSKIIGLIIPKRWYRKYANYLQYGVKYFLVIIAFDFLILGRIFKVSVFGTVLWKSADWVRTIILWST